MIFDKFRRWFIEKLGGHIDPIIIEKRTYNFKPIPVQSVYKLSNCFISDDWIWGQSKRTIISKMLEELMKSDLVIFDKEFNIETNECTYRGLIYLIDPREVCMKKWEYDSTDLVNTYVDI